MVSLLVNDPATPRPAVVDMVEPASVATATADDVDRHARFPSETLVALRANGVLRALIPVELGGDGIEFDDVCRSVFVLAQACSSSAMVLAMHHLQVMCLVRHGHNEHLRAFTSEVAAHQYLLASATSEVGTGGALRRSNCSVETDHDGAQLTKTASVLSYGRQADAILATARRNRDSAAGDQVLVCCQPGRYQLNNMGVWDALGMRGTCSAGCELTARFDSESVFPDSFAHIATETMVPVAHVLWSHVWLGIAAAALDRARQMVRSEGRANPGADSPSAGGLAELLIDFQRMEALAHEGVFRWNLANTNALTLSMSESLWFNTLKVAQSRALIELVGSAMLVCGMAGYRDGGPLGLGRQLRDAFSAPLMVGNGRIMADSAPLSFLGGMPL